MTWRRSKAGFSLQAFVHAGAEFDNLHWGSWSEWWDGFGVVIEIGFASKEALLQ